MATARSTRRSRSAIRRPASPTLRAQAPVGRTVVDAGRPPMSNARVVLHFLIAIGMFLGIPVAISLFAKLVLG